MKRTLLLSSAVVALTLGLTPALAQDRIDSKTSRNHAATGQQDRSIDAQTASPERRDRQSAATNDRAGARSTTGQASPDSSTRSDQPNAAGTNSGATDNGKSADSDKSSAQPKRVEENNQKPSNNAASKSNTTEPSRKAEQNGTKSPNAQKSTQRNESNRNARSGEPSKNAETGTTNRNAAGTGGQSKTRVSASLDPQKKTRLHDAIAKIDARPVTHVNFSVSVGTVVPRTVDLRPLPRTIVEIVPQYRGYDFFVVRDEVVIVEPRTHRIVDVIVRGPSPARAETTTTHRPHLSAHQREIIRRHASSKRRATTGSATRTTTEITVGERLPDSVEIETFPETVYREVPAVRSYRYIERGADVYLVDPADRRVIEEIR